MDPVEFRAIIIMTSKTRAAKEAPYLVVGVVGVVVVVVVVVVAVAVAVVVVVEVEIKILKL